MTKYLAQIKQKLTELCETAEYPLPYFVPDMTKPEKEVNLHPYKFFLAKINEIEELAKTNPVSLPAKHWTEKAIVYNMLVRLTSAYDHDSDGEVNSLPNQYGLRETGTFLKTIALLPYILSLGVNTIYLLPITSIGEDGKKGNLGSPYAIKNPYLLDENLAEPFLGMSVEEQFSALVEGAHLLGMKVVLEFVFRTSSLDGDWAMEHPEWYYWIKSDIEDLRKDKIQQLSYSAPKFSKEEILHIKEQVRGEDYTDLLPPAKEFIALFTDVPEKVFKRNGKIFGITKDGTECRIPPAFADWPPDDNQPPWSDVTFLRLYDHPDFNYIAYNTIRMYDNRLKKDKYIVKELWEKITGIIPYYQKKFTIDGVMLDMGHALPDELRENIVKTAKEQNPDFVFWEENFTLNEKSALEGYEAVAGYLPFDEYVHWKLKSLVTLLLSGKSPIPCFLSPETHNTPRAAFRKCGMDYSRFCWALNCLLPGVLFIHSGFELGETQPVNTGLDFSEEEISLFPTVKLPLFSVSTLNWKSDNNITEFMRKVLEIRSIYVGQNLKDAQQLPDVGLLKESEIGKIHDTNNEYILAIMINNDESNIIFIGNMSSEYYIDAEIHFTNEHSAYQDLLDNTYYELNDNKLYISFKPYQFYLGKLK